MRKLLALLLLTLSFGAGVPAYAGANQPAGDQAQGRGDPTPPGGPQSPGEPSGVRQSTGRGEPAVSGQQPQDAPAGAPEVQQQGGRGSVTPEKN